VMLHLRTWFSPRTKAQEWRYKARGRIGYAGAD
jgi:hypothetical protein